MKNEHFLLADRIKDIADHFMKKGWITIYQKPGGKDSDLIYCCLVKNNYLKKYLSDRNWQIQPGSEGKPSTTTTFRNGKEKTNYHTYDNPSIEPFLFRRHFSQIDVEYLDISEEFVLYWNLYEEATDKKHRKYYYIDEMHEKNEVIIVEPESVKIKYEYLMEYLSVKKIHFAICFDFERWEKGTLEEQGAEPMDKDYVTANANYNHFIRYFSLSDGRNIESWIHGKVVIRYKKDIESHYTSYRSEKKEQFVIGVDEYGKDVMAEPGNDKNLIMALTFFKRAVLDKYYNDPENCTLDGFNVKSSFFSMTIDNNHMDHVAVFLKELLILPHKEQLHWKHYNIRPPEKGGLSGPFYETMIEGNWATMVGRPDNYFKQQYATFNKKWEEKFGWPFYKPLRENDLHFFTSLHLPSTNNIKTFCEQMMTIVKLTIDSINEEKIVENIEVEKDDKGIAKLIKFLQYHDINLPDMILYLRHLQNLRSGFIAHRFSETNTRTKDAINYFGIKQDNYINAAMEIFIKSVYTLNTLTNRFLKSMQDE